MAINWPPPTGWLKGRRLRHPAQRTATHQPALEFRSLSTPGDYAPALDQPSWSLHSGLDPQEQSYGIWMLANGLVVRAGESEPPLLCLFATGPNILRGLVRADASRPSLFSTEHPVQTQEDMQRLVAQDLYAVLLVSKEHRGQGLSFALSCSRRNLADAEAQARAAMESDPLDDYRREMAQRARLLNAAEAQSVDGMLAWEAHETLVGALRDPKGVLRHRWSESDAPTGVFSVNELFPLVMAWSALNVDIAEDLIRESLNQMQPNGFVPAWIRPDGSHAENEMAWPMLAGSTRMAIECGATEDFAAYTLPRLATYLEYALERFDHKGHYVWRFADEAFVPETFDQHLATVDLTVLLLCDVDAFIELANHYERAELITVFIRKHRDRLHSHLMEHLWDNDAGAFRDCYADGAAIKRATISTYLPLLYRDLEEACRMRTLKQLQRALTIRKGKGLELWAYWETDPIPPPSPVLQQSYLLQATRRSGSEGTREFFERYMLNALSQAYASRETIPADLSAEPPAARPSTSSGIGSALVLALSSPGLHQGEQSVRVSKAVQWLDRHRVAVSGAVLGILFLGLAGIIFTYQFKRVPTAVDMEMINSLAERHYRDGRFAQAIALYEELTEVAPDNRRVHLLLANAHYRDGQLGEAERHYRLALDEEQPGATVLRNLAITLYRQQKYEEAAGYFNMIIEQFSERYPQLVDQARTALEIIEPYSSAEQE